MRVVKERDGGIVRRVLLLDDAGAEAVTTLAPPNCTTPAAPPLPACPNPPVNSKLQIPTLRNIELTAPYMHDGRFPTLEEAVEHYATGVKRSATLDQNLAKHPDGGVPLRAADKKALVAFLKTLTDDRFAAQSVGQH